MRTGKNRIQQKLKTKSKNRGEGNGENRRNSGWRKDHGNWGHVRPDGDCVGSCMALYLYIKKWYPEIKADIYLEKPKPVFGHIACMDEVHYEAGEPREYDLL